MKTPITITQFKVIRRMSSGKWFSAYDLGCSIATLNALTRKKIVEKKNELGYLFFPATNIKFRALSQYRNLTLADSMFPLGKK